MRSWLFVPGDQPTLLEGASTRGADALILDLEDAVAASNKVMAREAVAHFLSQVDAKAKGPQLWVRINPGEMGLDDIAMLVPEGGPVVAGIIVPKVETLDELDEITRELEIVEAANDREDSPVPICALIESAEALFDVRDLALHPRVVRLAMGEADLSADLGVELTPGDERELLTARAMVVMASAAARIGAPIAPVSTDFRDLDAFRASTVALRRLGFGGRAAIHPAQVPIVNEVFTPTVGELERARAQLAAFAAAGGGACVGPDGTMIDEAVVRSARRVLARGPI